MECVAQQGAAFSYDLLDAWPLEAAGAALLLDVAGRAVSCASTGGNRRARRQLHVFLIDTCRATAHTEKAAKGQRPACVGKREILQEDPALERFRVFAKRCRFILN